MNSKNRSNWSKIRNSFYDFKTLEVANIDTDFEINLHIEFAYH